MTQKTVREKIEGIVDGYSYNPKHATDKILKVIDESLPKEKEEIFGEPKPLIDESGKVIGEYNMSITPPDAVGYNQALADVKERLGVSEIKQ